MSLKRIDTAVLYQPFLAKLIQLNNNCLALKWDYVATSGLRTYAEQETLYAQGRTAPGRIITRARGGQSLHNFGVAVDFAPDMSPAPGLQPSWEAKDLQVLHDEAVKLGLESGLSWPNFKDPPHIQLPHESKGIKLTDLDRAYKMGGYTAVFALLDKCKW
jgi:peptidoglycan L-alanyl-D-glutamate endopeptidase CwlK